MWVLQELRPRSYRRRDLDRNSAIWTEADRSRLKRHSIWTGSERERERVREDETKKQINPKHIKTHSYCTCLSSCDGDLRGEDGKDIWINRGACGGRERLMRGINERSWFGRIHMMIYDTQTWQRQSGFNTSGTYIPQNKNDSYFPLHTRKYSYYDHTCMCQYL